jgi:branched-chain amino acid transport system substrate-binding protein
LNKTKKAGLWPALRWLMLPAILALVVSVAVACDDDDDDDNDVDTTPPAQETVEPGDPNALKLGLLLPYTGDLADFGPVFEEVAVLAINEINAAGGVFGRPIEYVTGNSATNPQDATEEARRLIEIEGVHAIIGPAGSDPTLAVAESVTGRVGIPQISPSATSAAVTLANDNDFLFRMPISDAAQGVVLADLAQEQGLDNICSLYVNNAYGQGLSEELTAAFTDLGGTVTQQIPHEEVQTSYASELQQCGDATTLLAISYPVSAGVYLREAIEGDLFENYLFVDGTKSDELFRGLGWENFDGLYGTAPGALDTAIGGAFSERYEAEYGQTPDQLPFMREVYDAVYAMALAAEKAGSTDGTAIRDALREIANPPGTVINPGEEGWAAALEALGAGEDIDFEGASSAVNWDENGDVLVGAIEIWQIQGEEIVVLETRPFDLTE